MARTYQPTTLTLPPGLKEEAQRIRELGPREFSPYIAKLIRHDLEESSLVANSPPRIKSQKKRGEGVSLQRFEAGRRQQN